MTSIDDRLRDDAVELRAAAERRARDLTPPAPTPRGDRRVLAFAAAALLVVGGIVAIGAIARQPSQVDVPPGATDVRPAEFEPIAGRDGWWRIADADIVFWMPASGWQATTQPITPEDSPFWREFVVDRPLSIATFPLDDLPPPAVDWCEPMPFAALSALGPTDALLTVVELVPGRGLPERPRNDGTFAGRPEDFYPGQGEYTEGACERELEAATGTSVGGSWAAASDAYLRYYPFVDGDRSFSITVAVGPAASEQRRTEVWQMFDRLDFHPA